MPRIISFSCLLHFLLWQRGDGISDWRALLFRTVTKMRRLEGSSYGWPLYIRSSSHCKPVIMVSPYLSDCRDCSISCDNNLLEQGRKKQTSKRCCSPITYLSPLGWLILSGEHGDCSCVPENSRARKQEAPCPPLTLLVITQPVWPSGCRISQIQFHEWGAQFCVDTMLQNTPKQHCRTRMCFKVGLVATVSYLTVKPKSMSALP